MRFTDPNKTCFAASDINPGNDVTSANFIQSEVSIHATCHNLVCCKTSLNVTWVRKRVTYIFNSFWSNVSKQVTVLPNTPVSLSRFFFQPKTIPKVANVKTLSAITILYLPSFPSSRSCYFSFLFPTQVRFSAFWPFFTQWVFKIPARYVSTKQLFNQEVTLLSRAQWQIF